MDLSKLEPAREPVFLHLLHPVTKTKLYTLRKNEEGEEEQDLEKPIGFMVVGSDSPEFHARERWIIDQRLKRAEAAQRAGRGAEGFDPDSLAVESENTIIACIKGFVNINLDGEDLQFSPENARMLFKRLKWAREFLDKEIVNRANFIKG